MKYSFNNILNILKLLSKYQKVTNDFIHVIKRTAFPFAVLM